MNPFWLWLRKAGLQKVGLVLRPPSRPLAFVKDPRDVNLWEDVGYLTEDEYWSQMRLERRLSFIEWMLSNLSQPALAKTFEALIDWLMQHYVDTRIELSKGWDAVIQARGWDVQAMHDSEYGLTFQHRTLRRVEPKDKPVSVWREEVEEQRKKATSEEVH